jgi:hypothetical protein
MHRLTEPRASASGLQTRLEGTWIGEHLSDWADSLL